MHYARANALGRWFQWTHFGIQPVFREPETGARNGYRAIMGAEKRLRYREFTAPRGYCQPCQHSI